MLAVVTTVLLHKLTSRTVRCVTVARPVLCSDREGGLCDVASLNRLNGNIVKEGGTNDCEDGGGGESSEIHVGSDCSGDAEGSDRFWPAGVTCCHLTATV
jgi:hypothetical protein